jgi:hypothetical protein
MLRLQPAVMGNYDNISHLRSADFSIARTTEGIV